MLQLQGHSTVAVSSDLSSQEQRTDRSNKTAVTLPQLHAGTTADCELQHTRHTCRDACMCTAARPDLPLCCLVQPGLLLLRTLLQNGLTLRRLLRRDARVRCVLEGSLAVVRLLRAPVRVCA